MSEPGGKKKKKKKKKRKTIRAAGGLVVRGDTPERAELLVVHRPGHEDWSIPKGKHDSGEDSSECAIREVWEETSYTCRITGPAGVTRYQVKKRPKEVDYFLMRPHRSGAFRPNDEVDRVRWVRPDEAVDLLTYEFDRDLVASLDLTAAVRQTTLHIVRHAEAGERSSWLGADTDRPLSSEGEAQAKALGGELGDLGIRRLLSSPYLRCSQTLEPLAAQTGLAVEYRDELAEGAQPEAIAALLREVAGTTTVLCSHGDVIPTMLKRLEGMGTRFLSPFRCEKGSTWVIAHDGDAFVEATHIPPPGT